MDQRSILRKFLDEMQTKEAQSEEIFASEYLRLKRLSTKYRTDKTYPTKAAEKQENVKKNRYKDIVPFDHSRVKLSLITSDNDSDYINASFIKGVSGQKVYIATQGPLPHTVLDFWRMVWQYNVKIIVMACREFEMGRKKCERYWSESAEAAFECGPFTIDCVSEDNKGDYITRVLNVTFFNECHTIQQLHYVNWPDHGVPTSIPPILEMLWEMRSYQDHDDVPICVHCSAGCGRTGALCVIDYTWNLLKKGLLQEDFSIFNLVQDMRTQRPSLVQTKEQYELVYKVIKYLFEGELQRMDNSSRKVEVPDAPSPIEVDSDSEFSDISDISEHEEKPRQTGQESPMEQHDLMVPETSSSLQPYLQLTGDGHGLSVTGWYEPPHPDRHPLVNEVTQVRHRQQQFPQRSLEDRVAKHRSLDFSSMWTPESSPRGLRKPLLCLSKSNQPSWVEEPKAELTERQREMSCGHQQEDIGRSLGSWQESVKSDWELLETNTNLDPETDLPLRAVSEGFHYSVEDPYFTSNSPRDSLGTLESCESLEKLCEANGRISVVMPTVDSQWTSNPCYNTPRLMLNDCELSGTGNDDESPPPLPARTPESFILASAPSDPCAPSEPEHPRTELIYRTDDIFEASSLLGPDNDSNETKGSPPSPVPPLPERTPESFILASEEDFAKAESQTQPPTHNLKVGTSLEWCGNSEQKDVSESSKSWRRSKSLKARFSLFVAPSASIPTLVPVQPAPPAPAPAVAESPSSVGPPLPDRTPESFVLALEQAPLTAGEMLFPVLDSSQLQPAIQVQKIGTSSEWCGNSQPKKLLETMKIRSKSVKGKSSKLEPLSVVCPAVHNSTVQAVPMPPGNEMPSADGRPLAVPGMSSEEPQNKSTSKSLSSISRSKSLRFLKRKTKNTTTPESNTSEPPSHNGSSGFKFGFGNRFSKPKGPRKSPEAWV
ncbi:tyrosine-protein phosphatase non-receptor type 22 isoform X2 [Lepisosteus oculatus]|uniref:tyrosine-protein phosphatase non-receptor type 22 isoform X2 n=1 Tax=Lepisosteus oculatus TaxID=7918 RepID=UPI0007402151|nr:PREDICTED: tyrosine-protein phosphatase non-receptor type 22 isoform X2 [Lepisosteus oculatus]